MQQILQPIFQKKELQTVYKTAVIEQEKAAIQFKQAVMTAVGEVSNAMANYKGSTERLNLVSKKGSLWIKLPKMQHYCIKMVWPHIWR